MIFICNLTLLFVTFISDFSVAFDLGVFSSSVCGREEPVFQAIWAENFDFDEILVSPTMLSDHSPFVVFDALQKVSPLQQILDNLESQRIKLGETGVFPKSHRI